MARKVIFAVPQFDPQAYAVVNCGPLMVEAMMVHKGLDERLGNQPKRVTSKIAGGMLPYDMEVSLQAALLSTSPQIGNIRGDAGDKIAWLIDRINNRQPVIMFVGHGAGHWLMVCGYEDDGRIFYVLDTRQGARDENGLVQITIGELYRLWGKIPLPLKPIQWLGRYFPRLRVEPYTVVRFD